MVIYDVDEDTRKEDKDVFQKSPSRNWQGGEHINYGRSQRMSTK